MNKNIFLLTVSVLYSNSIVANINDVASKNILFIICDDLRPELNCYGNSMIVSPNIDKLAENSVVFNRAYCNIPVSGASRASIFTGLRPTKSRFVSWNARVDKDAPNAVTLQKRFKDAGYITIANGKVYHNQDEASKKYWDKIFYPEESPHLWYQTDYNKNLMKKKEENPKLKRGLYYEYSDCPDSLLVDWTIAEKSISDLWDLKSSDKPFLMSIGFIRPHLPFIVSQKYWDLYDDEKITIPDNYVLKEGNLIPKAALWNGGELSQYSGIRKRHLDMADAKKMIHGYYASVSCVDVQVGRVLDALKKTGLNKTTIVVFIGDHGWNLGEHGMWCKNTILNTSLRSTLMISHPEYRKGEKCNEIVEFVDLYPTICEMAGIEYPLSMEGESILPLVVYDTAKSKGYCVSRWNNGFTLIKDNYFYTEWRDKQNMLVDNLLFDHINDSCENYNVVQKKEYYRTVKDLSEFLNRHIGRDYLK